MPVNANGDWTPPHNFVNEYDLGQEYIRDDTMDEQFDDLADAIASDSTTTPRPEGLARRTSTGKLLGDILGNAATATVADDLAAGSVLALAKGGTGVAASNAGALLTALGALAASNNLSGLANTATARTNLGLGTAAVLNSEDITPTNYLQYAGLL